MNITGNEKWPVRNVELSPKANKAMDFVLSYKPFSCYDSAPRIMAILLRDDVSPEDCSILTTPSSGHYWVKVNGRDISTVDMSNFRESPTNNDRCNQFEEKAKAYALGDLKEEYSKWLYDKDGVIKKQHEKIVEHVRNPSN